MSEFISLLQSLDGGELVTDLGGKLRDLVKAVREARKGGSLTLKLEIRPAGNTAAQINATAKVTVKNPDELSQTLLFTTEDGELKRENPQQKQIDYDRRAKAVPDADVIDVDDDDAGDPPATGSAPIGDAESQTA